MADGREACGWRGTDLLGRAIFPSQFGEPLLDRGKTALEAIVGGIVDLRRVVAVVGLVRREKARRQPIDFGRSRVPVQLFHRDPVFVHAGPQMLPCGVLVP